MIKRLDQYFKIDTAKTSYIISITKFNHVVNCYYGSRIDDEEDLDFTDEKYGAPEGTAINYSEDDYNYTLDMLSTEVSSIGKGDFKEPSILIDNGNNYILDLVYQGYEIKDDFDKLKTLPSPKGKLEQLTLHTKDLYRDIDVDLIYVVDETNDIILRRTLLRNRAEEPIYLEKIMSMQLEMVGKDFTITSLYGGWGFEGQKSSNKLDHSIFIIDSKTGNSSNRHNPFFMLEEKGCSYNEGSCYAFNLIYSSSHYEMVEQSSFNKIRIQSGISPTGFRYKLEKGEEFESPFALMTYSDEGRNKASINMHDFIKEHILRETTKDKYPPILVNNWEATYMKFDKSDLKKIIKEADKLSLEMFVLDDGWFSSRNSDSSGLGDYDVNRKKLKGGLDSIIEFANKKGLDFGLWFEPEMVNEDSKLFNEHPDWIIAEEGRKPSKGRHQHILDLTNPDVVSYIITSVNSILDNYNIKYVKWDMNRHFSDIACKRYHGGEVYHRYIMALYHILDEVILKHPDIYFEGCASGGNRFDLGMLSYFDQIWTSDDTDAIERVSIQSGYALAYPIRCLSNHVNAANSHSVLRQIPLDTRLNVALFGALGFELDLSNLQPLEKKQVESFLKFYKEHRDLIIHGDFYQLEDIKDKGYALWEVVSKDKSEAVVGYFNSLQKMNPSIDEIKLVGLDEKARYSFKVREQQNNIHLYGGLINQILPFRVDERGFLVNVAAKHIGMPIEKEEYTISGKALMSGALKLTNQWCGTGVGEVRVLGDFGSRVYYIKKI